MATACAMVLAGCSVDSIEQREYASRNIMPQDGTPYELEFMQQVVSEVAGTRAPMTELQPPTCTSNSPRRPSKSMTGCWLRLSSSACLSMYSRFRNFRKEPLMRYSRRARVSANSMRWFAAI